MMFLKQSTSVDVPIGPFLDELDGKTAETGLTITQPDVRLKKNGGNWAQKAAAQTLTHEENGWYEVTLDATDTDTLGHLMVAIHESGALPVSREFMVIPANIYDSFIGGSDVLDVSVTQFGGSNITQSDGRPEVNTTHVGGTAQTAGDLKASLNTIDDFVDTEMAAVLAAVDTEVAAIKAQTDKLTFDGDNHVAANVQKINDVTVNGDGAGTPWGP